MKVLLIGSGNIGTALLKAWVGQDIFETIVVVQPSMSAASEFRPYPAITFVPSSKDIPAGFKPDMAVFAVKPQMADEVLPAVAPFLHDAIVISVLAGTRLEKLEKLTGKGHQIVRIMPNVALKNGQSVNLAYANNAITKEGHSLTERLLSASGRLVWLADEEKIDLLAPISGSGPAYFFLLAELLVAETVKCGIDEETARELVQQTFIGSAGLVADNADFAALRKSVTSKAGVTEAALNIMMPAFVEAMPLAMQAAFKRTKELAQ